MKRILIFRALQLGDMLCAVPAIRVLRAAYPHSEITLLSLPWARDLVKRLSYIDCFEEFPGYSGLPEQAVDAPGWKLLLEKLRAKSFDLVVQMHGNGFVSNTICDQFGARAAAGFYTPQVAEKPGPMFFPYPEDLNEIHRLLYLTSSLGLETRGENLEFPVAIEDEKLLWQRSELCDIKNKPYIVIHPGARDPKRRWHAHGFSHIADRLISEGFNVVITGSRQEADLTATIISKMNGSGIDTGKLGLPLGELAVLIRHAALVVCNDTGVSHLSCALKVPSAVMFLPSNINRWAPLDRTLHQVLTIGSETSAEMVTTAIISQLNQLQQNQVTKTRGAGPLVLNTY